MDDAASSPSAEAAPTVLVWHPAIRAMAWICRWTWWSLCLSFVVGAVEAEWLPNFRLGETCARALMILAWIAALYLPLDFAHGLVYRYRRLFEGTGRRIWPLVLRSFAVVAVPYAGIVAIALHYLGASLSSLRDLGVLPLGHFEPHGVVGQVIAVLAAAGLAALLWQACAIEWRKHRNVVMSLGTRRLLRGYALMTLMRLRQNRRDFFEQAPLISNVRACVFAVVVHEWARGTGMANALVVLVLLNSILRTADELCPPLWLFLGRSTFEGYRLFTTLQHTWRKPCVNLLDRASDEWFKYYLHWKESWRRAGSRLAFLPTNPKGSRAYSIRPRGDLWVQAAWNFMDFVPVVVIDGRTGSVHIDDEIVWAVTGGILGKVWLVCADDGDVPALRSAADWVATDHVNMPVDWLEAVSARVVTEAELRDRDWDAILLSSAIGDAAPTSQ